jgi:hypothetical protein
MQTIGSQVAHRLEAGAHRWMMPRWSAANYRNARSEIGSPSWPPRKTGSYRTAHAPGCPPRARSGILDGLKLRQSTRTETRAKSDPPSSGCDSIPRGLRHPSGESAPHEEDWTIHLRPTGGNQSSSPWSGSGFLPRDFGAFTAGGFEAFFAALACLMKFSASVHSSGAAEGPKLFKVPSR